MLFSWKILPGRCHETVFQSIIKIFSTIMALLVLMTGWLIKKKINFNYYLTLDLLFSSHPFFFIRSILLFCRLFVNLSNMVLLLFHLFSSDIINCRVSINDCRVKPALEKKITVPLFWNRCLILVRFHGHFWH
jgi:hypothetical protein